MHYIFHIGAHGTDAERLLVGLRQSAQRLGELDVGVPRPRIYRTILRDTAQRLQGASPSAEEQAAMASQILGRSEPDRVIFNHDRFMGDGQMAVAEGKLYPQSQYSAWLRALFPEDTVDFALGIRNPATWIPAIYAIYGGDLELADFLEGTDPRDLSWRDYAGRILEANPGCRIILWCNEDLPLIWPEVLRIVADVEDDEELEGDTQILAEIMQPEGLTRLQDYLKSRPPQSIEARREVTSAFLEKFVIEAKIEEEFDLPGWNPGLVSTLTRNYEADLEKLADMDRVLFIRP